MKRFQPSPRPDTLRYKVKSTLEESRYMPPGERRYRLHVTESLGMDADARGALERLLSMSAGRALGVAGRFMPDAGVSRLLASRGIEEGVEEADFGRFRAIVIPTCGVAARQRAEWVEAGHRLEDFTLPKLRRAQVALGLLKMEGAQGLVIGRHEDPESLAIARSSPGTRIIEDTTDTARLVFSPAFGVVCQPTLSPRKTEWLVQQLRFRYRDAKVTFLNTACDGMTARDEALEKLLPVCDHVLIVGDPGEASCEALLETATRRGRTATIVAGVEEIAAAGLPQGARIALTAGAYACDEAIRGVAAALCSA